jgi:hypothetical protein
MKRLSHYQRPLPAAEGSPPRRGGRRATARLRGGLITLVLLVALLMVPASASSAPHGVFSQPLSANPCTPGSGVGFTFATPIGTFPASYCKHAVQVNGNLLPPFSNFALLIPVTPVGPVAVTGKVTCLSVVINSATVHTANELDLIVTSNSALVPVGSVLLVRTVDNDFPVELVPQTPTSPPDQIGAFLTPPPGPPNCPPIPFGTSPVTSGGLIVF